MGAVSVVWVVAFFFVLHACGVAQDCAAIVLFVGAWRACRTLS